MMAELAPVVVRSYDSEEAFLADAASLAGYGYRVLSQKTGRVVTGASGLAGLLALVALFALDSPMNALAGVAMLILMVLFTRQTVTVTYQRS